MRTTFKLVLHLAFRYLVENHENSQKFMIVLTDVFN